MLQENLAHFPCCQIIKEELSPVVLPIAQFAEKCRVLSTEFTRRIADSKPRKVDLNFSAIRLQLM